MGALSALLCLLAAALAPSLLSSFRWLSDHRHAAAGTGALPRDMARVLLSDAAASPARAVCLDGTPGAFYLRRGAGAGASRWFVHLQGGGWCSSLADCAARAGSDLGSSAAYPEAVSSTGGYYSKDFRLNPLMADWNHVLVRYCDGTSWTGDAGEPVEVPPAAAKAAAALLAGGRGPLPGGGAAPAVPKKLHFRGLALMRATLADLLGRQGMAEATEVVLSGCSAGGLAVLHHLDRWREVRCWRPGER